MGKHTKGPWQVVEHVSGMIGVNDANGKSLCAVGCNKTDGRDDKANAALIASAPDLLQALEAILATWEGPRERAGLRFAKDMFDARAAIAKARGQ